MPITTIDVASRTMDAPKHKKGWKPGGERGKLHREIGVPAGEKIPAGKLAAAAHSKNPEIRRDAIRAKTMKSWNHSGKSLYKQKG